MKSPASKKTRSKGTKPIRKVPQLDILALGERISHLEEVVGKLIHCVKTPGMDLQTYKKLFSDVNIDPETKKLI
jgi:hypothetical protein